MKLLMDTNFLMDLCRFRIDLSEIYDFISEHVELFVLSRTLTELESLSKKAKHGKFAKLSLTLIKKYKITVLDTADDVDKGILKLADKTFIVATNDKKLRQQLQQKGVKTIYLRARKHLAIG